MESKSQVLFLISAVISAAKITSCVAQQGNILLTGRSGYELPITYEEATAIEYCGELDYSAFSVSVKSELQSTPPRGGATERMLDERRKEIFQSTPPRGGRPGGRRNTDRA